MATITHAAVDMSHVTEILEGAHKILRRSYDHELASQIMALPGYLELSRMNPDRSHDNVIQKAFDDLATLVHSQLLSRSNDPQTLVGEAVRTEESNSKATSKASGLWDAEILRK